MDILTGTLPYNIFGQMNIGNSRELRVIPRGRWVMITVWSPMETSLVDRAKAMLGTSFLGEFITNNVRMSSMLLGCRVL